MATSPLVNNLHYPDVSSCQSKPVSADGMTLLVQSKTADLARTNSGSSSSGNVGVGVSMASCDQGVPTTMSDCQLVEGVAVPPGGLAKRTSHLENLDSLSNPPLSPISESSSGVCNNLSGGNTRSVSAAVSDESVAGDSGVFEASMKRWVVTVLAVNTCLLTLLL